VSPYGYCGFSLSFGDIDPPWGFPPSRAGSELPPPPAKLEASEPSAVRGVLSNSTSRYFDYLDLLKKSLVRKTASTVKMQGFDVLKNLTFFDRFGRMPLGLEGRNAPSALRGRRAVARVGEAAKRAPS